MNKTEEQPEQQQHLFVDRWHSPSPGRSGNGKKRTMDPQFFRRQISEETHDSICSKCLVMIATDSTEADLDREESVHACDPMNLYRVSIHLPPSSC